MLRVGLTGGLGAGKSAVAGRLAALGAVVVDSDVLAREVVAPGTDGLAEVVAAFGDGVRTAAGALDRPALAAKVFGDDAARRRLEGIIHPRVRARTAELMAAAPADAVVVNDVPLLVEVGLAPSYHLVMVVEAARAVRVSRLASARGMTPEQAAARIAAQAADDARRAVADVLLGNDGPLAELHARVDTVWRDRLLPYERNLRHGEPVAPDDPVRLVAPDPTWPAQARRLIARLRHALGGADITVDHIGSTAVPGLPAKDVIDLQVGVPSLDMAGAAPAKLAAAGFPARPGQWFDLARGEPGARWPKRLHGSADPARPVNLHVRVTGSPGWRFALLMRDHLRAAQGARDAYADLKRILAAGGRDADDYAAAKEPWFDEENVAARSWAAEVGWRPSAG